MYKAYAQPFRALYIAKPLLSTFSALSLFPQPSSQSVTLDVGEDRVRLVALPSVYLLDIDLPYLLDIDNVGAQFNKDTRVCACRITWVGGWLSGLL